MKKIIFLTGFLAIFSGAAKASTLEADALFPSTKGFAPLSPSVQNTDVLFITDEEKLYYALGFPFQIGFGLNYVCDDLVLVEHANKLFQTDFDTKRPQYTHYLALFRIYQEHIGNNFTNTAKVYVTIDYGSVEPAIKLNFGIPL